MSTEALERITPVAPPAVNKKINPNDHPSVGLTLRPRPPYWIVEIHLNTLIPVGTAIHIVANEK